MQAFSKKRFGIAIFLAFFLIYFIGGLRDISGNSKINPYSPLFILSIHLFILSTFTFFSYVLLGNFKKPLRLILLMLSAFLVGPLVYYTLFPSFLNSRGLLSDWYILIGDPLRDIYGINWYWMDWGVWVTCVGIYLLFFYLYVANLVIGLLLHFLKKSKPKKKH